MSLEAALWGAVVVTKRSEERNSWVRLRYHFRAVTGHQTLSSETEEKEAKDGRKISTEPKEVVWFFAIKEGIRWTPEFSQQRWPGSTERAWRELRRWPEATAMREKKLISVRWNKEALWRQSTEGARRRTFQEEGSHKSGDEGGVGHRRTIREACMKRGDGRYVTSDSG